MNKPKRAILIVAVLLILFFVGSSLFVSGLKEHDAFVSPEKTNTIIVEYDFVSRPTVYKKNLFGKEKIWEYEGTGFNETVRFDIEWISEDQFRISYCDSHGITEEFEVAIP